VSSAGGGWNYDLAVYSGPAGCGGWLNITLWPTSIFTYLSLVLRQSTACVSVHLLI
jgi:hypothetical protein